jgi:hypothetical protein
MELSGISIDTILEPENPPGEYVLFSRHYTDNKTPSRYYGMSKSHRNTSGSLLRVLKASSRQGVSFYRYTDPATSPITPRAPDTGGVDWTIKLKWLGTLSTLVSPDRASIAAVLFVKSR